MAGKRGRGRGRGKGKAKAEVVEETPVEETPVEETPVDETAVEETAVEETAVEETAVEEAKVEAANEEMEQSSEPEVAAENTEMDTEEQAESVQEEAEPVETNEEETAGFFPPAETGETKTETDGAPTEEKPTNDESPWMQKVHDKNKDSLFMQVRGFPYDAPIEKMAEFFELTAENYSGCEIAVGIKGKPCGEFFFKAADEQTALNVLLKHKELFVDTGRYIDVFRCSEEYYQRRLSINMHFSESFDGTIKFKFIPFNSCPEGVVKSLLEEITYLEETLVCPTSASGKTTGIAFVQFANFSEARKVLEKNGTDGIKIVESCNNELRGALLVQAKLAHMKKWADVSIGGGTYFSNRKREIPQANKETQENPETQPDQTVEEPEAKIPKTDITPESFMADITQNAPNKAVSEPVVAKVEPVKPKMVNNSPYPHIITLSQVAIGTKATEIQKFFKPHRAIAVNIRAGGMVDVAFKTHEIAEKAMEKMGGTLKDFVPDFELNSVA